MATAKAKPLTLSQTASTMRKLILASGIVLTIFVVGRVFLEAAVGYWNAVHPAPPPPPTVGFGRLPSLAFPPSTIQPKGFTLQISQAALAPRSDRAYVFFQPSARASLLAVDKASKQAVTLGFLFQPERITSEQYRWRRTQPLPAVLDYNIVTGAFRLRVNWQSNPAFLQGNKLPNEDQAITLTKQALAGAGILQKDIATGSAKVTYLKADGDGYTNTVSFSEADFLQVDVFRTPIRGQFPVVTERPTKGTVRALLSGNTDKSSQIVALEYNYLPVDYLTAHTYPIITPSSAYQLLAAGKGYSASIAENQTSVTVRSVYLAYYDSGTTPQSFMQPIYVFEGDGGYVGYVPAIDPKWSAAAPASQ